MTLVNVTETFVQSIFADDFSQKYRFACDCTQCRDDILAIALNRLPSRYVSTDRGISYVKAEFFSQQVYLDIIRELTIAAEMVGSRPNHATQV